jgi:hypothetical protein
VPGPWDSKRENNRLVAIGGEIQILNTSLGCDISLNQRKLHYIWTIAALTISLVPQTM